MNFLSELTPKLSLLLIPLFAILASQLLKIILLIYKNRSLNIKQVLSAGGMPSSHAAFVSGLSTAIGLQEGFDSAFFAICLVFSLVVFYDAAGVRRAAGNQAKRLNQLTQYVLRKKQFQKKPLSEFLGHTPLEVIVGAIVGILVATILKF